MAKCDQNEPPLKKLKTDKSALVFDKFLDPSKKLVPRLQSVLLYLVTGSISSKNSLVFLKIVDANARSCASFTEARCTVKEHVVESPSEHRVAAVSFEAFFKVGYKLLNDFVCEGKLPDDQSHCDALEKLLEFLMMTPEAQSALSESRVEDCEWKWAIVLIQHLFSKLSLFNDYRFDHKYKGSEPYPDCCPCTTHDELLCIQGDTSFGCTSGWHGKMDILMGDVPVNVNSKCINEEIESCASNVSVSSGSSIGEELGQAASGHDGEMLSQIITFAFLKTKGLIPLIGIGVSDIVFNFYDCQLDILLRSAPMEFKLGKEMDWRVITMLWMCLNYNIFCSGVPNKYSDYKSTFHQFIDVNEYMTNTVSPFPTDSFKTELSKPEWWKTNHLPLDKEDKIVF